MSAHRRRKVFTPGIHRHGRRCRNRVKIDTWRIRSSWKASIGQQRCNSKSARWLSSIKSRRLPQSNMKQIHQGRKLYLELRLHSLCKFGILLLSTVVNQVGERTVQVLISSVRTKPVDDLITHESIHPRHPHPHKALPRQCRPIRRQPCLI